MITTQCLVLTYMAYPEVSGTVCAVTPPAPGRSRALTPATSKSAIRLAAPLGQLTFKEVPNYEAPADANRDNEYMVTVVVTDAGIDGKGKLSAERDVVVTVTNVNEPVTGGQPRWSPCRPWCPRSAFR